MKSKPKTRPFDPANYLETDDDMAAYLEAAVEDGDAKHLAASLNDVARAMGLNLISRKIGLSRAALAKIHSPWGEPEIAALREIVQAMESKLRPAKSNVATKNQSNPAPLIAMPSAPRKSGHRNGTKTARAS